jgi:DNA-binding transcriptional ArsR family regulator
VKQEELVKIFKALANENRLKILEAIKKYQTEYTCCPQGLESLDVTEGTTCCVDEIGVQFEMAQSTVSQHLKELYNAGLLERHKKGKWVYYTIKPEKLEEISGYLREFASELVRQE